MRKLTFLITLALAATLYAQPSRSALDRAVAAVAGKEASFSHHFTPKGFKSAQAESGTVIFGSLPNMRWTYTRPESKTFVFNGSQSWFYVPADRQVTVGRVDEARKRELPFLLLGDAGARDRIFSIKEQKRGASTVVTLTPRSSSAVIRNVTVTVGPGDLIQRIDYSDREGNRTSFSFSGYHPRAASAETFRFSPPAGVQITNAE